MTTPRKVREYALHVRRDGVEVLVRKLPEIVNTPGYAPWEGVKFYRRDGGCLPAHHVVVLELEDGTMVEETTIDAIKLDGGERFRHPRPHGKGWKLHAENDEKWSAYRRPLPTGERAEFADADGAASALWAGRA